MSEVYKFLDFSVDSQTHVLLKADKRIDITSKAYKLLLYFLQNQSKTLSRKQLNQHVWSDRIVSDSSLDKLIQRLRNLLGDTNQHKEIISTIHGVGFVFLPEVRINNPKPETLNEVKIKGKSSKIVLGLLFLMVLVVYFLKETSDSPNDLTLISEAQANPMIISLIPNLTDNTDTNQIWMVNGGMHYLYEKFTDSMGVEFKNISLQTLADNDPDKFAIDLGQKKQTNSSIIVSIKQLDGEFIADVKIRSIDAVIAQKSFNSLSIKSIYDDIALWAQKALNIKTSSVNDAIDSSMSNKSYAVENYMRGISAELSGDAQQAIKYLELATNEEKKFWLAWLKLSTNYRKQGQYEKAMSIVKVFENANITDQFKIMVSNSKVNIHNAMGEFDQALSEVDLAIGLAKKIESIKSQYILLSNKAYTASQLGQYTVALESINESIRLIKQENENNHSRLGYSLSTLSGIENNMQNYKDAQTHARLAIKHLTKAGNERYVAKLKLRLSSILSNTGDWNEAENLVADAIITLKKLNSTLEESTAYMRLIDFQLIKGEFDKAQINFDQLTELMATISSKDQANYYLMTKSEIMLANKHYEKAKDAIDKLGNSYISDYHRMSYYLLGLRYFQQIHNTTAWEKIANEFIQLKKFNESPMVYLTQAQLAQLKDNRALAIDAFEQAKTQVLKTNSARDIATILNSYILFLLEQDDIQQAQKNLLELEKYVVPPYPYLKVKAQTLYKQGDIFNATANLEELKSKAGSLWSSDDQLLLEHYHNSFNDQ